MSTDTWLAFALFAFVSSITPGPNNTMLLASGVNFGFVRSLPHMAGVTVGFCLMILLLGLGVGSVFVRFPVLYTVLRYVGGTYMLYLAWKIFRSPPPDLGAPGAMPGRFGLLAAASLQLVNPKTWMMALAVLGVFAGHGPDQGLRTLQLAAIFFVVSLPCLAAWACLGVGSARLLRSPTALRRFNRAMGLLLLVSAWLGLLL